MNENLLNKTFENNAKKACPENDHFYFGHGKLLITGEYFVIDGAQSLALPTKLGQSLSVKYAPSFSPTLSWKSFDVNGNCWFDHKFEFWHFKCLSDIVPEEALFIQKVLLQVRKQNPHFLRDEVDVKVETHLGFPLSWGLGSSSSLIYNIAQWAYVSPFELLFKTYGGSGYDIACAQSDGPILYKKSSLGPNWSPVNFNPKFKENLYFVYLGKKQNSRDAVKDYTKKKNSFDSKIIPKITELTQEFLNAKTLGEFKNLMTMHENIIGEALGFQTLKESTFKDFDGAIKSLGAWGGDFALVATDLTLSDVKAYFNSKGLETICRYDELISPPLEMENHASLKHQSNNLLH
jgi:mevalonate kinase